MQAMTHTSDNFPTRLSAATGWLIAFLASVPAAARAARRAEAADYLLRLDNAQLARLGHTRTSLKRWVAEG